MAQATQRRRRSEAQRGLGYFEPLNAAERAKRDDDGRNVRARSERLCAKGGFRTIDKADLHLERLLRRYRYRSDGKRGFSEFPGSLSPAGLAAFAAPGGP